MEIDKAKKIEIDIIKILLLSQVSNWNCFTSFAMTSEGPCSQ